VIEARIESKKTDNLELPTVNLMTEKAIAKAREFFAGNYNCAQSVMKAILTETDLDFSQIVPLTAGLGGGMAHEGNVCGSVSGAIAALGVLNSSHYSDILKHKEVTYAVAEEFVRRFKKEHGSILCNDLTGVDIKDTKARNRALKDGTFAKVCPHYVESAVKIVLELSRE
jgi:C_GCAxxG_C_C family probable redox protein